jgi:hypothetical protein
MLGWLQQKGCKLDANTSRSAAVTVDNLRVLQFLYDNGCPWHDDICGIAGEAGDLEQLKWLHAHGAVVKNRTASEASRGGAVHVFEWLQQQGVGFSEGSMNCAAMYGRLQLCQWLRAQQCPWSDNATDAAAFTNHCETLRWLLENGCPYSVEGVCTGAVSSSHGSDLSTLQYLYDQGIMADPAMLTLTLNVACSLSKLAAAKWLRQRGAEWPAVLCSTVLRTTWCGATLAWARAEGCTSPVSTD